jgi:diguanylate cyclase (GGDEF)-like protein
VPDTERLARLAAGSDELSFRVLGAMSRAAWAIAAGDAESLVELFADALAAGLPARRYLTSVRLPNGARITVQRVAGEAEMGPLRGGLSAPGAPEPWLRVPIGSAAHDYGELVAVRGFHGSFNRAERRRLQEVADLVAGALDAAVAVDEQRRAGQRAVALLELSQLLADAGPSDEVALRLLDAVRLVVDCDRVSVLLWDPAGETFTQRACGGRECATGDDAGTALTAALAADGRLESFIGGAEDVMLVGPEGPAPALSRLLAPSATQAAAVLPLVSNEGVFGVLVLALIERPERFEPSVDLLERLRGVAAQAAVAMTNGRLVDLIAQHALHDSLTGLANRLQFHDMLRASVDLAAVKEASVALMYIDLDGFKPINDQYGHDVGDELLVAVGERLREVARASDSVGRLGGDEFAILLTSAAGVGPLAGRLAEAFEHPFEVAGRRLSVGASIGWAAYPEDADSAEGLIQAADAAMYVVKQSHKRSRAA